ncbi:ROK family protein [Fulvivirgaceae bacterium BMA12]|uniref:ROK family protein n=1 Tax=Agaribacillus aureus TaxID=3051825 RepID=A0ABT8LH02_9BACT|nr:ROK family protein [Fulvivirgaceae bacterium BMA12]
MKEVSIGIDMGGTKIKIGLVNAGRLLASKIIDASSNVGFEERLKDLQQEVDGLLTNHRCTPNGIGIAFPGIVDSDRDKIISDYVKYPDAQKVDIRQWASYHWGISAKLENDSRAALLGEWQYGAGKGCDNLVLITLGTGVGTAVLLEGKLLRGKHYLAGNLGGHMSVNIYGKRCNCGNIGCLESESSTWALRDRIVQSPHFQESTLASEKDLDFHTVFKKAEEGDLLAGQIKENSLKAWSLGIINLIHAYDPEKIVIGGGIMKSKEIILPYVKKMIKKHSWLKTGQIAVTPAKQLEYAGILGMGYLLTS